MSDQERRAPKAQEEDRDEEMAQEANEQTQQIIQTGGITATKGKHIIHCLTIVGQIEGHYILPPQNKTTKYEHVIPQLVAIQEDPDIQGLLIVLNTVGGDVEAGLAIAELVSGMNKPTVSLVLGGGHSIGVPLAVSAQKSFIAPSATMTVHPVRMNGLVLGVPQTLSYFDKMQERIVRFVVDNSKITAEKFKKLMMQTGELVMDVGTVLTGKEAVAQGLIDQLGGLSDAVQALYKMIEKEERAAKKANKKPAQKGAKSPPAKKPEPAVASPRAIAQLEQKRPRGRPKKNAPAAIGPDYSWVSQSEANYSDLPYPPLPNDKLPHNSTADRHTIEGGQVLRTVPPWEVEGKK